MFKKLTAMLMCAALVMPTAAVAQSADAYPNRPIRLLIPFAPGGLTDTLGRMIAEQLGTELKQTVIVENKPGAGTMIGARALSAAAPDGYTIMLATSTTLAAGPAMFKDYVDPVKSMTPISLVATNPFFLVASAASGYKSAKEVAADAQKQGAKGLSYGSAGTGTPHHLIMEMFREEAKVNMTHVPYAGSGTAINGLYDGSFNVMITDLAPARGFLQNGKLVALAVADNKRSHFLPDVPTFAEAGYPATQLVAWQAIVAPPGLPAPIAQRLSDAIHKIVDSSSFGTRCIAMGCDAQRSRSPAEFRDFVISEGPRWKTVIANAKVEVK